MGEEGGMRFSLQNLLCIALRNNETPQLRRGDLRAGTNYRGFVREGKGWDGMKLKGNTQSISRYLRSGNGVSFAYLHLDNVVTCPAQLYQYIPLLPLTVSLRYNDLEFSIFSTRNAPLHSLFCALSLKHFQHGIILYPKYPLSTV